MAGWHAGSRFDISKLVRIAVLTAIALLLPAIAAADYCTNSPAGVLLYSSMDSEQAIYSPCIVQKKLASIDAALPGRSKPGEVTFENSLHGKGARFNGVDNQPAYLAAFDSDNFDFSDPEGDGGRLDLWIKFNTDPHKFWSNLWVFRTDSNLKTVYRTIVFEPLNYFYNNRDDAFMIAFYSDAGHAESSYSGASMNPRDWGYWKSSVAQNEWHIYTITWRNNGPDKGEMHLYIDGRQDGCWACNDYSINLPEINSSNIFMLSPHLNNKMLDFSVDEIWSFSSWDFTAPSDPALRTYASLQRPDQIRLAYPLPHKYPLWGQIVTKARPVFQFIPIYSAKENFACDLYINGSKVRSVVTSNDRYTEILSPVDLSSGTHTYQLKCDADRLVSEQAEITVALPAHCGDGIKSGNESGVDCGGSCQVCSADTVAPVAPKNLRSN
ncbi:MAG: hypothetical protein D6719_08210 [Candidatus Dadabacteria bacterium]|nr:MAG: hypothetical protein D6719_08210 [Candidatus Dadabacteria bacterium]